MCAERVGGTGEENGYVEADPTGRYGRFKEVLGKGAMKVVYKAFDEVLGMEVAWNLVNLNHVLRSAEDLQRLYSEVHLLSTLNRESIIRSYTSWINVERRTFNFITEMFTSGTLREYRQKYKRVDIRAVKGWARQILDGLVYLHGHDPPVIHRDLKCDNIFVNGHLGQVKIGDLGLAAILRGSQAHSVIGTPEFMAPELYEEEYNELVDIYSFGMCVLEMLTSEYPYSECFNPAQIYKKVTSGKLPDAFYRIHDLEARRFVGRCLESASKRLPAKELLLDPFLTSDDSEMAPLCKNAIHEMFVNDNAVKSSTSLPSVPHESSMCTDMTITGNLNPEDDTIFLKVQIADKDGHVRNIYFPFDIVSDTPMDVATEMVKELEIMDLQPMQIADMIEKEISVLIPHWKELESIQEQSHHTFSFEDDDDNEGLHHPFYSFSSCSSSQTSLSGLLPACGTQFNQEDDRSWNCDWLEGELLQDDESSSQNSLHSGNYANLNYNYHREHDFELSPRTKEYNETLRTQNCTRFCPEEHRSGHTIGPKHNHKKCKEPQHVRYDSSFLDHTKMRNRHLTRNQSCLDIRSQLLHRSLIEEMKKRHWFKTVGAVENIGFQAPCEVSTMKPMQSTSTIFGCPSTASKHGKRP